ncbi:MAG: acetyl-CoA acetyltransferase [Pseudomonadota bacterium]
MVNDYPLLVGLAQKTYRDSDPTRTKVVAMEEVTRMALEDSGSSKLLASIDTIVTVPFLGTQVPEMAPFMQPNPGAELRDRLGIDAKLYTAEVGGNLPQHFVNYFSDKLMAGKSRAVLITGSELLGTLFAALKRGIDVSHWRQGGDEVSQSIDSRKLKLHPTEIAHGLFKPINVYPMIEAALQNEIGHDTKCHQARLARIISNMSCVAANNPHAWVKRGLSPKEILCTDNGNRMISHPYTRAMTAILGVDMACAVILTSQSHARELGIDDERCVFLTGCSDANDVDHFTERADFVSSPALEAAAAEAMEMANISLDAIDAFDIYSCFPSAVQVALKALGLDVNERRSLTVTGGLTVFGGPGNNYSLHAIAEMGSMIRSGRVRHGMITANGGYLTKHSVGIYSSSKPDHPWKKPDTMGLQSMIDNLPRPKLCSEPSGNGYIETFTVTYGKNGPERGIVIGRLQNGQRFVSHTSPKASVLQRMIEEDVIGATGKVTPGEPENLFEFDH